MSVAISLAVLVFVAVAALACLRRRAYYRLPMSRRRPPDDACTDVSSPQWSSVYLAARSAIAAIVSDGFGPTGPGRIEPSTTESPGTPNTQP